MKRFTLLLAVGSLVAGACTSSNGGGGVGGGAAGAGGTGAAGGAGGATGGCTIDSDCGAGKLCGFAESAACNAKGQCFPAPGAMCQAYSPGCACDGTMINIVCTGLPQGYASKPLAHDGECTDAGCGGDYICLSTVHCAADADCAALGSKCDTCTALCGCGTNTGNCCPSAWSIYSCTFPDGGTGLACHDPAMGCASSTTCGEGCDAIVVGSCDGG